MEEKFVKSAYEEEYNKVKDYFSELLDKMQECDIKAKLASITAIEGAAN